MINLDTFYQDVQQSFRELNRKIDVNHNFIDIKIGDLSDRVTKMETEKDVKTDIKIKESQKKYRDIAIIISCVSAIGGISGIWTLIQAIR